VESMRSSLVYSSTNFGNTKKECLRDSRRKYVLDIPSGKEELYDLVGDPLERTDIAVKEPETVKLMSGAMKSMDRKIDASMTGYKPDREYKLAPEEEKKLRALGYLQ